MYDFEGLGMSKTLVMSPWPGKMKREKMVWDPQVKVKVNDFNDMALAWEDEVWERFENFKESESKIHQPWMVERFLMKETVLKTLRTSGSENSTTLAWKDGLKWN